MIKETVKTSGVLRLVLRGPDGKVKDEREIKNLIVTTGLNFIASRMDGAGSSIMSHTAVGTGTTAAAVGNTALETETARVAQTSSIVTTNSIQFITTFAAGTGTGALTEAGTLNASSSGTLLCRTVFSVINKGASDSLVITWTVTIS